MINNSYININTTNYHRNDRSKTYLCMFLKIHVSKRTMLSRSGMVKGSMKPQDAEQIGRSILGFVKMIVNPEMVEDLGQSTKVMVANTAVTNQMHDYITDKNSIGGTSTIKTNFLAAFVNQNKHLVYPYQNIAPLITNPRVMYHPSVFESKGAAVRTLVEMPMIMAFAERMAQIEKITILGDNISIPGRTHNINRDLLVSFKNGHEKDFDIKTTKYDASVSAGHLREICVSNNEIVTYPRDYSNLYNQYQLVLHKIGQVISLQKVKMTMSPEDYAQLVQEYTKIQAKVISSSHLLTDHSMFENSLVNIVMLKTYPSNINFYNIYHIKNGILTEQEMVFLNKVIELANPSILDKPSYMQKYLVDCLHIYHQHVNSNTYSILRPLTKVFPFIKQLLINYGTHA